MSGTTCASLTLSVVVAGPGFNKTLRLMVIFLKVSGYRLLVIERLVVSGYWLLKGLMVSG